MNPLRYLQPDHLAERLVSRTGESEEALRSKKTYLLSATGVVMMVSLLTVGKARGKNTYTHAQTRPVRNGEALEWLVFSESHVVGVAEIDEQHRHLVRLVNRLNRAVTGGHDPAQIAGLFVTLNAATREHFATEHHYMQGHDYPAMTAHELERKRLLDDLAQIAVGAGPGRELLILQTLKDWLLEHIQNSDRLLGQYLVRHGCR